MRQPRTLVRGKQRQKCASRGATTGVSSCFASVCRRSAALFVVWIRILGLKPEAFVCRRSATYRCRANVVAPARSAASAVGSHDVRLSSSKRRGGGRKRIEHRYLLGRGHRRAATVRVRPSQKLTAIACIAVGCLAISGANVLSADVANQTARDRSVQTPAVSSPPAASASKPQKPIAASQQKAAALLQHTIDRIANGPAFNAKVRQRVWSVGREVVGVGTYEQAGYGSGRFNLQMTMHDGGGKHTLQQISDGRLAWTRTEIAGKVSLRRVDVGRLEEWIPAGARQVGSHYAANQNITHRNTVDQKNANQIGAARIGLGQQWFAGSATTTTSAANRVPPRLKVGAWTELLDTFGRDHLIRLGSSTLQSRPVIVITGTLKDEVRREVLAESDQGWPAMYPVTVKVAIATDPDPETGFGEGLPLRFEFWGDPVANSENKTKARARLISLIEMYAIHPMTAPPVQRFRFENQDAEVNFTNETDRYLQRYGVRITDSQRRLLLR